MDKLLEEVDRQYDLNKSGKVSSRESMLSASTAQNSNLTYQFDIRILCVSDLDLADGTQMKIYWIRGTQQIETSLKLVANQRVYFQQKFSMKTAIEIDKSTQKKKPKLTRIKVIRINADVEEDFGECELDLADYTECADKTSLTKDLIGVSGAKVEFSVKSTL